MTVSLVTVLICTHNRARLLQDTLDSLVTPADGRRFAVEIIIVDNNSTDCTRQTIEAAASKSTNPIRYVFEPRQGKGHALNRGLQDARGDIVALTDDDVIPAADWLERVVAAFESRDISFAFGKVLPRWGAMPPPELLTSRAQDIWGPLALIDYGDQITEYSAERFHSHRLPIGANLAFRRDRLLKVGGWRTDLGKENNTLISGEDHEIFVRLLKAGLYGGVYDPENKVFHYVPPVRLTRKYFRRWFYWHGKTMARMQAEMFPDLDLASVPHIAGAPRFVYRQFLDQVAKYLSRLGRQDALELLIEELRTVYYLGFFREAWRRHFRTAASAAPGECSRDSHLTGDVTAGRQVVSDTTIRATTFSAAP
jgi:glucosyl-dolichyl phosphate glucuronosyltransferase